jgi:hypothetical protein
MSLKIVNRLGFFMALAAFGLAYTLRLQWASLSIGMVLAIGAGMCLALDLFWRTGKGKRKWFRPSSGGSLMYMPLWFLALAWLGLGAYQTCVGPIPALAKAAPQMTWSTSSDAKGQGSSETQKESKPVKAKNAKH